VVAYNKLTGDVFWKTPNLGNETYASPAIVKIDGEDHIVMVISMPSSQTTVNVMAWRA
jgi:outer membrane protein assembly factor BamB